MLLIVDGDPIGQTWLDGNGYRRHGHDLYEHISVAEKALGRKLPVGAIVHHVDDDKANNKPSNLVICPNQSYHLLLHARARIVDAGGNPNTQKLCSACKKLKLKDAFSTYPRMWDGRSGTCRDCTNDRRRGKGYGVWNERRKQQQRDSRARKARVCC